MKNKVHKLSVKTFSAKQLKQVFSEQSGVQYARLDARKNVRAGTDTFSVFLLVKGEQFSDEICAMYGCESENKNRITKTAEAWIAQFNKEEAPQEDEVIPFAQMLLKSKDFFGNIDQATQIVMDRFSEIRNKNPKAIEILKGRMNTVSHKIFERITGISMGTTQEDRDTAIMSWFGEQSKPQTEKAIVIPTKKPLIDINSLSDKVRERVEKELRTQWRANGEVLTTKEWILKADRIEKREALIGHNQKKVNELSIFVADNKITIDVSKTLYDIVNPPEVLAEYPDLEAPQEVLNFIKKYPNNTQGFQKVSTTYRAFIPKEAIEDMVEIMDKQFRPSLDISLDEAKKIGLNIEEDLNEQDPVIKALAKVTIVGNVVRITEQLPRELYEKVKKKLEGIGGVWDTALKGIVFPHDPRPLLKSLLESQTVVNLKKDYQFFPTPLALAKKMIALAGIKEGDKVLEPSAGNGAILELIPSYAEVSYCEIMPQNNEILQRKGYESNCLDFLTLEKPNYFDKIIANPPFRNNQDIDHVYKMWEVLKEGGRMVVITGTSWTFGSQNKQKKFREWLEEIGATQEEVAEGTFKESGTNVKTMLLVIDKPFKSVETEIITAPALSEREILQAKFDLVEMLLEDEPDNDILLAKKDLILMLLEDM